jgi:hypothetical protein
MPWTYTQSTGELANPDGLIIGIGYSGRFEGLNNPAMQAEHNTGPIPQGKWEIGKFFNDQRPHGKGPMVCPLIPFPETETFGRTEFMIHGDNKAGNHTASEGCIILGRYQRDAIAISTDRTIEVIA